MSLDFAAQPTAQLTSHVVNGHGIASNINKQAKNLRNTADQDFDSISRKLTAGPLTLEYLVAYSIETYSERNQYRNQN